MLVAVKVMTLTISHTTKQTMTATERAQCEYLCKNVEMAQQLFDEVLAHVEDVWETIEVYTQRNQMSICLQRYDVRLAPLVKTTYSSTLGLPD